MSDQTTQPAEAEPTAPVDTPEGTDQTQQEREMIELERYKQLQAEFTRTRQQMTDPEYQAQVAQEWLSANGYALPTDEEPEVDEFADPSEALRAELEELKQWRDQFESSSQQQQQIQALEDYSERKLSELGLSEDDPARDWIVSRAIAMNPTPDGQLDIEGAHRELEALQTHLQKQWRETKRAPRAPGSGQAATQTKNVDDMSPQELLEWQMQQLHDMES
jgi:hypothetical protein